MIATRARSLTCFVNWPGTSNHHHPNAKENPIRQSVSFVTHKRDFSIYMRGEMLLLIPPLQCFLKVHVGSRALRMPVGYGMFQ